MPKTVFEYEWDGDANGGLDKLSRQVGATATKLDGLGTEFDATAQKMGKVSRSSTGLADKLKSLGGGAMGVVKVGAAASAAALVGLGAAAFKAAELVGKLSEAGTEQDVVFERLSAAVNSASDSTEQARESFGALQGVISELAVTTDFGDEAISDALTRIIQQTGRAEISTREMSTVLGIAAQRNIEASDAAEIYAKALSGDVAELKNLTPLTNDQAAALSSITDETERSAKAVEILSAQYEGLATTTGTARSAVKNLADAKGDLFQAIGRVINASGAMQSILDPLTGLFRALEAAVLNNSASLQRLALDVGDTLVGGFEVAIEAGAFLARTMIEARTAFGLLDNVVRVMGVSIIAAGRILYGFAAEIVGFVVDRLGEVARTAERVASAVGADGLASQLSAAGASIDGFRASVDDVITGNLEDLQGGADAVRAEFEGANQEVLDMHASLRAVEAGAQGLRKVTGDMRDNIARARVELKPLDDGFKSTALSAGGASKAMAEIGKEADKATKKLAEQEEKLRGGGDQSKNEGPKEAAEPTEGEMRAEELSVAARVMAEATGRMESDALRISKALGGVSAAALDAASSYNTLKEEGVSTQEAFARSAAGATGAIGDAISSQIENTRAASAVRGAFAAAEAVLYGATGNIPAAIAAGAAASMHFANAAIGGGGGAAAGAGAGASAPARTMDTGRANADEASKKLAERIVDGLNEGRNQSSVTIQQDFSGAIIPTQSPEFERVVAEASRRGLEGQGIFLSR